jgi:hypothetical protein
VQSVTKQSNPTYYGLISEFELLTGVAAIMNTSFNLKGDAIVESPKDAIETFYTSGLDYLIIGHHLVGKAQGLRAMMRIHESSDIHSFRFASNGETATRFPVAGTTEK